MEPFTRYHDDRNNYIMEILTFTMLYVVAKGGIWFRYNSMFIYISTVIIGLFRKNIFYAVPTVLFL